MKNKTSARQQSNRVTGKCTVESSERQSNLKVLLDERYIGWKVYWMKGILDERYIRWKVYWMKDIIVGFPQTLLG